MAEKRNILVGVGLGVALGFVLVTVFFAGVFVGTRKEPRFFPFEGDRHGYREFVPGGFNGHGVIGTIDSIGSNTLVVKDRVGALKTVLVDNQTQIRRGHTSINFSELKTDEQIIVLGEPEEKEGAIKARLIRMMGSFNKEATSSGMLHPFRLRYLGS